MQSGDFDNMIWEAQDTLDKAVSELPLELRKQLRVSDSYKDKSDAIRNTKVDHKGNPIPLAQDEAMSNSYSMVDGRAVSNKDAIPNDFTGAELQMLQSYASDQTIRRDEEGKAYNFDREGNKQYLNPNSPGHFLYGGDSKGDGELFKVGKAKYGVEERNNPFLAYLRGKSNNPAYGWKSGERGIDEKNPEFNWELPGQLAGQVEAIHRGNRPSLDSRYLFDDGSPEAIAKRKETGSGGTEMFDKSTMPLLNAKTENINKARSLDELIAIMQQGYGAGSNSIKSSDGQDPYAFMRGGEGASGDRVDNLVDATQYGVGSFGARAGDAIVDAGTRVYMEAYKGFTGKSEEEAVQHVKDSSSMFKRDEKGDFIGLDKYKRPEEYDYNDKRSQKAMKNLGKAFESGDILEMGRALLDGLLSAGPEFALESAGEVLSTLNPLGLTAAAAGYANDTLEERAKNLAPGEKLGNADRAIGMVTGVAMAAINKLGGDEILGRAGNVKALVSKIGSFGSVGAMKNIVEGLGKKLLYLGGKGAYEGVEEIGQQIVQITGEKFDTEAQKEIFSSETGKELFQAFGGGVAGGVSFAGAGQVAKAPGEFKQAVKIQGAKSSLSDMDTYLDERDKEFLSMDNDAKNEELQAEHDDIIAAKDELAKARKSGDLIGALEGSENQFIKNFVTNNKLKYVEENAGTIDPESNKVPAAVVAGYAIGDEATKVEIIKTLGTTKEEFDALSFPQKEEAVKEKMKDKNKKTSFVRSLSPKIKEGIFNDIVRDTDKIQLNRQMLKDTAKGLKKKAQDNKDTIAVNNAITGRATKTKNKRPRIEGDLDLSKTQPQDTGTIKGALKAVLGLGGKDKKAMAEINSFSTTSLERALDTSSDAETKLINKVLAKRKQAKKDSGIDQGTAAPAPIDINTATPAQVKRHLIDRAKGDEFADVEEVTKMFEFAKEAKDKGTLTDKEFDTITNRLRKIDAKTKHTVSTDQEIARKNEEAYKESLKSNEETEPKNADGSSRLYRFKERVGDTVVTHEGKIVFDDRKTGTFRVEAIVDGKKEELVFGSTRGKQVHAVGKQTKYSEGHEYTKETEEREAVEYDNEPEVDMDNVEMDGETETADASQKANEIVFGSGFDAVSMTDAELAEAKKELEKIFNC